MTKKPMVPNFSPAWAPASPLFCGDTTHKRTPAKLSEVEVDELVTQTKRRLLRSVCRMGGDVLFRLPVVETTSGSVSATAGAETASRG